MRLLHYCGLPLEDVDFINSDGKTMNKILLEVRLPGFTTLLYMSAHVCLMLSYFNFFAYFVIFLAGESKDDSLHW